MKASFNKLIGDPSQLPIEYRILNIVLLLGFFLSAESVVVNYLLQVNIMEILSCIISSLFFAGLYYWSNAKKQYSKSILILLMTSFGILVPSLWVFNGGTFGSVPIYVILFSSMAATLICGVKRVIAILF